MYSVSKIRKIQKLESIGLTAELDYYNDFRWYNVRFALPYPNVAIVKLAFNGRYRTRTQRKEQKFRIRPNRLTKLQRAEGVSAVLSSLKSGAWKLL